MAESRDGIHVSGGAFIAHNVAVGKSATVNSTQGSDLADAAGHLLALIRQHRDRVEGADALVEQGEALEQEARRSLPNFVKLRALLGGIAAAGASVEGLAEAVDAVSTLL